MIIFPFNLYEVLITGKEGKYFSIINVQNRQLRTIQTGKVGFPIYIQGIDYDQQYKIIACGSVQKIQFYCTNQSQIIFEQELINDIRIDQNQVRFLTQTQYLIIGSKIAHVLCLINYHQKQIYFLKVISIGKNQQLYSIINLKYFMFLTDSEIIILDDNLNITQKIKVPQIIQTKSNIIQIANLFLICNQDKIFLMNYEYQQTEKNYKI